MPQCASERCARPRRWWRGAGTGVTLDGQWLCSRGCVEDVVRTRLGAPAPVESPRRGGRPSLRLGALLIHHRACRREAIDAALAAQASSGLRLGEQLLAMRAVEPDALLRALAAQANVGYVASVDVDRVLEAPCGLTPDALLALELVPLAPPDGDRVRVACTTPVPRAALTAFRQQTGWTAEPFLVGDDDWQRLQQAYGAGHGLTRWTARGDGPVLDADDAARRIADAVLVCGDAQLHDVRWGAYVWLRVTGVMVTTDVIVEHVADEAEQEGESWLAATMSL